MNEPVTVLDLVPTLVDGLSLPSGASGFQGRSLLPTVFDGRRRGHSLYATTLATSELHAAPDPQIMLESGRWRILYRTLSDRSEIYDVDQDPRETFDLARELPLRALLLRQNVLMQSAWNRQLVQPQSAARDIDNPDAEVARQLEALGYVQ